MKPEPLKGKEAFPLSGNYKAQLFKEEDIRSAVEWLRKELGKHTCIYCELNETCEKRTERCCSHIELKKLINQAFEDVVKTPKEKG